MRGLTRARIPLSWVFVVGFLLLAQPSTKSIQVGSLVSLIGIVLRAWASGHIRKDRELAIAGPYGYTRIPLYLGSFVIGLGFCVSCRSVIVMVLSLLFFILVYLPMMTAEAERLRELFGEAYEQYEQSVPLFFPTALRHETRSIAGGSQCRPNRFDLGLYLRSGEYQVPVGFAAILVILIVKAL